MIYRTIRLFLSYNLRDFSDEQYLFVKSVFPTLLAFIKVVFVGARSLATRICCNS
jgi:hypothetical protein